MSCDWTVFCLDCETDMGFSDANHQSDVMRAICAAAPAFVALRPMLPTLALAQVSFEIGPGYGRSRDATWLVEHADHRLVPRDEYGRNDGQCHDHYVCDAGGWHPCVLDKGHAGPHAPKKPAPAPGEGGS